MSYMGGGAVLMLELVNVFQRWKAMTSNANDIRFMFII